MQITIRRLYKKAEYTIGNLYINDKLFCQTLEDTDRGLHQKMPLTEIQSIKKPGITAIPTGTYTIVLDVYSSKFGNNSFYKKLCNGKLPRLLNVPGFDGILIHCGNSKYDTNGCILVGQNKLKGKVVNSQVTFTALYNQLKTAKNNKESITLTIE